MRNGSPRRSGGAVHDAAIVGRRGFDGMLDQPCGAVADGLGLAPIEAEDRSLRCVESALEKRRDSSSLWAYWKRRVPGR